MYQAGGVWPAGPTVDARIVFGGFLPTAQSQIIEQVTSLVGADAITVETGLRMLVEAVATEHGGWMAGDRLAGDDPYAELAGPKGFGLDAPDQVPFLIGFAGSPRVAQTIIATDPPRREAETYSLHWWLTEYADTIRERCEAMSLLMDPGDGSPADLADHTHALVMIEGRVLKYGSGLSWEEPRRLLGAQR